MYRRLRRFLTDVPIADPIARRQAPLLQLFLLFLALAALPRLVFGLAADVARIGLLQALVSDGVALAAPLLALSLLRRGRFSAAVLTQSAGTLITLGIALLSNGVSTSGALLLAFAIPITLVGLLLGWRWLLLTCGLSVAIVAGVAWLERARLLGLPRLSELPTPTGVSITFCTVVLILFIFLGRFGHAYRAEIRRANRRERELEKIQVVLEARRDELEREVDRRQRMETQLLQSQKLESVGHLAGGIAHDFNNLLTLIQGSTELALQSLPGDHPARGDLGQVLGASGRASALTRQLLAFARKQIMEQSPISLSRLVLDMDGMLQRLIGRDIELITLVDDDVWPVYADHGQIEQVIINLALNARDAMPAGGRLAIEVANAVIDAGYVEGHISMHAGDWVLISVSDTGVGMTAEVCAQIFEPFFTTKEPGKGTGLGLSMCYGIVKQHSGNIWVYSEPGEGTRFKIYLPRIDQLPVEVGRPAGPAAVSRGNELLLLAEDEPALRLMMARVLRANGYTVLEAGNGIEALSVAEGWEGEPIALLVTDIVMPTMGGRDLADQIALIIPQIRVLFLSGYSSKAIGHGDQLAPGMHFMQKPFSVEALLQKVRRVLDS